MVLHQRQANRVSRLPVPSGTLLSARVSTSSICGPRTSGLSRITSRCGGRQLVVATLAILRHALLGSFVLATACGASESDSEPEPGPECQLLQPESDVVAEEFVESVGLPQGSGGQLLDGTYDLVKRLHYIPVGQPPNPPNQMRATLRVRGARALLDYAFVEDSVITPALTPTAFSARFEQRASTLALSHICPGGNTSHFGYTALTDTVTLVEGRDEFSFHKR